MDGADGTPEKPPQGWFVDPFGAHDARWFSQGTPTALVRDGRTESQDRPPDQPFDLPLVPARAAPATGPVTPPSDDVRRAGEQARDDLVPGSQLDFFGNPSDLDVGVTPAMAQAGQGGAVFSIPLRTPPPTPRRLVAYRWVALGLAAGWTLLLTGLLLSATTTSRTGSAGRATSRSLYASDPVGVALFVALLVGCCVLTGVGLWRRIRSGSESAGRWGYMAAGVLLVVGVLSLASIGLALVILAFALAVVARPIRRTRPIPGDRLVPPPPH